MVNITMVPGWFEPVAGLAILSGMAFGFVRSIVRKRHGG